MSRFLFFITLLFSTSFAQGQFVNNGANEVRVVYRSFEDQNDSTFIHVFHSATNMKLKGQSTDGLVADYAWYQFDSNTKQLHFIKEDLAAMNSPINIVDEGGYMLTIHQNNQIDSFYTWNIIDTFSIQDIKFTNTCLALSLEYTSNNQRLNYVYIDFSKPNLPQERFIPNKFKVEWSSNVDIRDGLQFSNAWQKAYLNKRTTISDPAPLLDAIYSVKVFSEFGAEVNHTSKLIPFMTSHAIFEVLHANKDGQFETTTDYKGEALYRLKLKNTSRNADTYLWEGFGNQDVNFEKEKIIWTATTRDVNDEIIYKPGKYPIQLTVSNSKTGCKSSTYSVDQNNVRSDITVALSKFDPNSLPNVFTPNGDDKNDIFRFVEGQIPVSLNEIDVKIFGRGGKLVYKYAGDVHQWDGWNGKINGSGGDCAEGVYYYVVSANGWDDKNYDGKPFTGTIHLFRGN